MKKNIFQLAIFLFFIFYFQKINAQNRESEIEIVSFEIAPPYTNQFADYAKADKLIMTLRNKTQLTRIIKFKGSLKGENTNTIIKLSDDRSGQIAVNLAPNAVKTLNYGEIKGLFDINGVWEYNIAASTFQSLNNSLPSDDYTFCLQVVDAQTGDALSENPSNCTTCCPRFTVESVEPPYLQNPINEQAISLTRQPTNEPIMFQWTPSSGSFVPNKIEYVLEIVEAGQNANQAFLMGNVLVSKVVAGTQSIYTYKTTDPPLEKNKTYAWRIRVQEKTGAGRKAGYNFQNEGKSEVFTFTYGETTLAKTDEEPDKISKKSEQPITLGECKCKFVKPSNTTEKPLANGDKFYIGGNNGFEVLVNSITGDNGTGTVAFALGGFKPIKRSSTNHIPLRVTFSNVKINTDNVLIAGTVVSEKGNGQPSLMPGENTSGLSNLPDFDLLNTKLLQDGTDLSKHWANITRKAKDDASKRLSGVLNSVGFSTPLGISQNLEGVDLTVAFDNFLFTPIVASYDAMTVLEDKSVPIVVPLGIKGACLSLDESCPEKTLYLTKDAPIGSTGLVLKGGSDLTKATYVVYNTKATEGFQEVNIMAEYEFSETLIKTVEGGGKVKAIMQVLGQKNFSNWTAEVKIPAFKITGQEDFEFGTKASPILAYYDHSVNKNPVGLDKMVNEFKEVDQTKLAPLKTNDWKGFFMPKLAVVLPEVFKTGNDRVQMQVENLVIDGDLGLTGSLKAQNVFAINNGNLDGWYYSLDEIGIMFFNGSMVKGFANGKLILPISGNPVSNATQLDYTNTLSRQGADKHIAYQFVIKPKDDVIVPIWKATCNLDKTSNITVSVGINTINNSKLAAQATLDGKITFKTPEIAGGIVPSYDLKLMEFQKLKFQSFEPYFTFDSLTFLGSLASPQHSVGGEPFTIDQFTPVLKIGSPLKVGFFFKGTLSLADIPCAPKASLGLEILGNAEYKNGRPSFSYDGIYPGEIAVEGELGPVHVTGGLRIFSNDSKFGDGFRGKLNAGLKGGLSIEGQAVFGKKDFSYWYFYMALSSAAPLIQIGPVSINGFGGGLYHNMTPPAPDTKNFVAISDKNYDYTPSKGTDGLKAAMYFSVASQFVFKAKVVLEGNMKDGVLSNIILSGDGQIISDGNGPGILNAATRASYDFPNKIFRLDAGVSGGMAALKVDGGMSVLSDFGKDKYYLKIGEPTKRQKMYLAGGLAEATGYFMVGNSEIPDIPEPSADIISTSTMLEFKKAGYQGFGLKPTGMPTAFEGSEALAFGATLKTEVKINYAIFYAKLNAGAGFDLNMRHYTDATCEETGKSMGANGWYAKGQAYFEFRGAVGINTFWDEVKIVELKAAALLGAGLPNPTYFQGFVHGEGSFLGESIGFTLPVKIGERCTLKSNPFSQDLIADILPSQTTKVDIMSNVEIILNYPRKFDVSYENANGEFKSHSYELKPILKYSIKGGSENSVSDIREFVFANDKSIIWNNTSTLQSKTKYKITFGVDAWEDGRVFLDLKTKKPVRQDKVVEFETGPCPKNIPEEYISYNFPFKGQKNFLQSDSPQGFIMTKKNIECLYDPAFEYKIEISAPKASAVVKDNYIKAAAPVQQKNIATMATQKMVEGVDSKYQMAGANVNLASMEMYSKENFETISVPVRFEGNRIYYNMPKMPNGINVEVKLVKMVSQSYLEKERSQNLAFAKNQYVNNVSLMSQAGMSAVADNDVNKKLANYNSQSALASVRNTVTNKVEYKSIPLTLYSYSFRTSKYNSFIEKMSAIAQASSTKLAADNGITIVYPSNEGFDKFDVQNNDFPAVGTPITVNALISAAETDNTWVTQRINQDLHPKWDLISSAMRNSTFINFDQYNDSRLNIEPAVGLGILPNAKNLIVFNTRIYETVDVRMENAKSYADQMIAGSHELHRRIGVDHSSPANQCGFGAYVCSTWNTIKDNYINSSPIWMLFWNATDYRNRETGNLNQKANDIKGYDLLANYKSSLPITPKLNFIYRDPLNHTKTVSKTYTVNR
jgi:hypothetical protein